MAMACSYIALVRYVQIGTLSLRARKLGLRQSNVALRCNSAVVAIDGELKVFVVGFDRVLQHRHLHILGFEREIVGREQRLLAEADVFEIRRAHLRVIHGVLHRQTHAAPEIRLPARDGPGY